jgi:hypothetical protein
MNTHCSVFFIIVKSMCDKITLTLEGLQNTSHWSNVMSPKHAWACNNCHDVIITVIFLCHAVQQECECSLGSFCQNLGIFCTNCTTWMHSKEILFIYYLQFSSQIWMTFCIVQQIYAQTLKHYNNSFLIIKGFMWYILSMDFIPGSSVPSEVLMQL